MKDMMVRISGVGLCAMHFTLFSASDYVVCLLYMMQRINGKKLLLCFKKIWWYYFKINNNPYTIMRHFLYILLFDFLLSIVENNCK